ncbi:hypothetical protein [Parvularcula sp. LCG005]|nr:hypothetical protein [Parvularcula sp. LCG005]WOI54038.1 hypothetical protein RUI03_03305 [Parvularcula sp. LCG005]
MRAILKFIIAIFSVSLIALLALTQCRSDTTMDDFAVDIIPDMESDTDGN